MLTLLDNHLLQVKWLPDKTTLPNRACEGFYLLRNLPNWNSDEIPLQAFHEKKYYAKSTVSNYV